MTINQSKSDGSRLQYYVLPDPPEGKECIEAVKASLNILELAPKKITYPLFSGIYRAPLGECLQVDFSLLYVGPTSSQKTELESVALLHYGCGFHSKNLPGNWASTDNALEKQSHAVKDAVFVVDDFVLRGTTSDVQRINNKADRLLRGQGNRSGRERMYSGGGFRPTYFPRGLILSSGEDSPSGQSLLARIFNIEVARGDVNLEKLTDAQANGTNGLFSQCMSSYIKWLAPQIDTLKDRLPKRHKDLRSYARHILTSHDRTPDIVASLLLGLETLLDFAEEISVITNEEADRLWKEGWNAHIEVAKTQAEYQRYEEPTTKFCELLSASLASGAAYLSDITTDAMPEEEIARKWGWRLRVSETEVKTTTEWQPQGKKIGWIDNKGEIFLEPNTAFASVKKLAHEQGFTYAITQRTLWKSLAEKKLLSSWEKTRNRYTIRKVIGGTRRSVIYIMKDILSPRSGPSGPNVPQANDDNELWDKNVGQKSEITEKVSHETVPQRVRISKGYEASGTNGTNGTDSKQDSTNYSEDFTPPSEDLNQLEHSDTCDCSQCLPSDDSDLLGEI